MTHRENLWQNLTRDEIAEARDAGAVVAIPIGRHRATRFASSGRYGRAIIHGGYKTRREPRQHKSAGRAQPALRFFAAHLSHAGTVSLRLSTYLAVLGDVASSLAQTGFRRIVFVNGHGGNSAPLRSKIAELVTDGIPATGVDYWAVADTEWARYAQGRIAALRARVRIRNVPDARGRQGRSSRKPGHPPAVGTAQTAHLAAVGRSG